MANRCCAFRKSDLHTCKNYAKYGTRVCSSHRNFYTKRIWMKMFCDIHSNYCPTGFGYLPNTSLGRIEHAIRFAIENDLIVLTEEDCASLHCEPAEQWHRTLPTLVDLWTILVSTGKVNPHWHEQLTKLTLFTFAKLRDPVLADVFPSLDGKLGPFLENPYLNPHNIMINVLGFLYARLRRRRYPMEIQKDTYKYVIHEFVTHPSFKPSLLLADSFLTQKLYEIKESVLPNEHLNLLVDLIHKAVKPLRAEVKQTHHNRVEIFKEELVAKAFHPSRVERWLNEGDFALLEMMF